MAKAVCQYTHRPKRVGPVPQKTRQRALNDKNTTHFKPNERGI